MPDELYSGVVGTNFGVVINTKQPVLAPWGGEMTKQQYFQGVQLVAMLSPPSVAGGGILLDIDVDLG